MPDEPLNKVFELIGAEPEIQMLGVCVQALTEIKDTNARARVVNYLHDRFGARVETA